MERTLRKNKKGFTLVEVIVVIAIIAILAAVTIPTLIGFVNKAEEAEVLSDARAVLIAVQAEAMSSGEEFTGAVTEDKATAINNWIDEDLVDDTNTTATTSDYKVTALTYDNGEYTATYDGSEFTVAKN